MGSGSSTNQKSRVHHIYKFSSNDVIGGGRTSIVYRATLIKEDRLAMDNCTTIPKKVAIKVINTTTAKLRNGGENLNEKDTLIRLQNSCAVKLYEYFEEDNVQFLVMDYCGGGNIYKRVKYDGPLPENVVACIVAQLATLISEMSSEGLVHRNLCPENIFMTSTENMTDIQVIDFGATASLEKEGSRRNLSAVCGSMLCAAPEIFRKHYDEKVDVWGIGVIMYFLLCGKFPYQLEEMQIVQKEFIRKSESQIVFRGNIWKTVSKECRELLCKLLAHNPSHRIYASAILNEPWIETHFRASRLNL